MALVALAWAYVLLGANARAGGDEAAPDNTRAQVLERAWADLSNSLKQASMDLAPTIEPPQPVAVRWHARRISSVDLGAPLLALETADLDGDGRAELIALTTRELVIVQRVSRRQLAVLARAPLPSAQPALRPRAPVGALVVANIDGDQTLELLARSSESARAAVFQYRDGGMVENVQFDGFPLCSQTVADLAPGRNYFPAAVRRRALPGALAAQPSAGTAQPPADPTNALAQAAQPAFPETLPTPFFSARCAANMVDTAGRPIDAFGIAGTDGSLHIWLRHSCVPGDAQCPPPQMRTYKLEGTGAAFAFTDIDNDGEPEVFTTASSAPGAADRATVTSISAEGFQQLYQRSFSGGIVGLSAGDIDGDGALELLAAVRLLGSQRVDIWVLNR